MIEISGKYAIAKVFTDVVDNPSISQVINLLNQPYVNGSVVRMMPDIHAGVGCTIGTTMTIKDKVCPNLVGVDIGCGMEVIRIKEQDIKPELLDNVIKTHIPSGFSIRKDAHRLASDVRLNELFCHDSIDIVRAQYSIGTLGGGNHFIEANRDSDGHIYIVVHSGSRYLGLQVANYYQDAAYKQRTSYSTEEVQSTIYELKRLGRKKEIQDVLSKMKKKDSGVPKQLSYVDGELFDRYIHDMKIAQHYAMLNRVAMIDTIVKEMFLHVDEQFTTIHNYIDTDSMILRKGAVSAKTDEKLIVPINMRDGSLICTGKGNKDWNYSAPHGAGRLMSRSAAKEAFTVDEFKRQMSEVYTTSVGEATIDECPMAYKSLCDIVDNIEPTVQIDSLIKPIYNYKAGNGD